MLKQAKPEHPEGASEQHQNQTEGETNLHIAVPNLAKLEFCTHSVQLFFTISKTLQKETVALKSCAVVPGSQYFRR